MQFAEIERDIELLVNDQAAFSDPDQHLLSLGEFILENWLNAKGIEPTWEQREGFRLLALHRQGAKADLTFHACRETCRELIYQINLFRLHRNQQQIMLSAMVAMHLLLFVRGKMETQELGEFCCSSKALRTSHKES